MTEEQKRRIETKLLEIIEKVEPDHLTGPVREHWKECALLYATAILALGSILALPKEALFSRNFSQEEREALRQALEKVRQE